VRPESHVKDVIDTFAQIVKPQAQLVSYAQKIQKRTQTLSKQLFNKEYFNELQSQ
jgi:hypothetical protein